VSSPIGSGFNLGSLEESDSPEIEAVDRSRSTSREAEGESQGTLQNEPPADLAEITRNVYNQNVLHDGTSLPSKESPSSSSHGADPSDQTHDKMASFLGDEFPEIPHIATKHSLDDATDRQEGPSKRPRLEGVNDGHEEGGPESPARQNFRNAKQFLLKDGLSHLYAQQSVAEDGLPAYIASEGYSIKSHVAKQQLGKLEETYAPRADAQTLAAAKRDVKHGGEVDDIVVKHGLDNHGDHDILREVAKRTRKSAGTPAKDLSPLRKALVNREDLSKFRGYRKLLEKPPTT
jgi:hypothetical protein